MSEASPQSSSNHTVKLPFATSSPSHLPDASAIAAAITQRNPAADPLRYLPDVHPAKLPRHVAIIMDGNGRWATSRGQHRVMGHREGAKAVERALDAGNELGLEVLTLYSFSLENWKRPQAEIDALMALYVESIGIHTERLVRDGVRFRQIGRREGLPKLVQDTAAALEAATAHNTRATLCLAVNYGGRAEIVDAAKALARKVAAGELLADDITEQLLGESLYAPDLPEPDLMIRTAGEMRISNFLLWQLSYAELHSTNVLWPDFGRDDLHHAIRDFASRTRKFGALTH